MVRLARARARSRDGRALAGELPEERLEDLDVVGRQQRHLRLLLAAVAS